MRDRPELADLERGRRDGSLQARFLPGADALVVFGAPPGLGARIVALDLGRRTGGARALARLLSAMDREEPGGVFAIVDRIPGISRRTEAALLSGLDFVHLERGLLSADVSGRRIPEPRLPSGITLEPLRRIDAVDLATVSALAYASSVDGLFGPTGDALLDGARFVDRLYGGGSGRLDERASFRAAYRGRLVGAVAVTGSIAFPHVADLVVAPTLQGKGVGRALLARAIEAVRAGGARRIDLVTCRQNPSGTWSWYHRLGFRSVRGVRGLRGGWWVRRSSLVRRGIRWLPANPRGPGAVDR